MHFLVFLPQNRVKKGCLGVQFVFTRPPLIVGLTSAPCYVVNQQKMLKKDVKNKKNAKKFGHVKNLL